ncbi:DUF3310 domain-containing protein [Paenibacillus pasadenensis]|uniref:DUF3310 domain-containing protein n=1 Tax=Paenibacillus pasadenensis TaxID=217090 RepID=UPI00203D2659|nr:DUF3310 domain-containing protein [Paenibacillus pasadenensis]
MSNSPVNPNHYKRGGLETIEVIQAFTANLPPFEAYLIGNVIKYTCRYKEKNGSEDLKKAATYLAWAVEAAVKRERSEHEASFVAPSDPAAARGDRLSGQWSEPSRQAVRGGGTAQAPAAGLADEPSEGSTGEGVNEKKRFVCNRLHKTLIGKVMGPGCGWSSNVEVDRCIKCGGPMVPSSLQGK